MSAKFFSAKGGRGVLRAPVDGGQGGAGGSVPNADGLTEKQIDELREKSAKEAIDSLTVQNAADKMPEHGAFTFPGPISEAYYWSQADVIGICGPVGSGKTTTKMKRKLRRAIEMPCSTKARVALINGEWVDIQPEQEAALVAQGVRVSGWRLYKCLFIRETYRQLWSTTIPSYLETYPKSMGEWSGGRGDPVTHKIRLSDEYGPIEFIAEFMAFGDDPVAAMRGVQTTDIDLNEADTMNVQILTVGIGRIDRWPGRDHYEGLPMEFRSYGAIDCDFNAPDEDNWCHDVFYNEDKRTKMAKELSAHLPEGARAIAIEFYNQPGFGETGAENLQNLSPSYYPRQIASMRLAGRGDMVDRLVYNKVVYLAVGDPVFKREFNRRIHVSDTSLEVYPDLPLRIGLDQGFKGAAVIGQFVPPFHWRLYSELHFPKERLLARVFGERLRDHLDERFPGMEIEAAWADMAGEHGASEATDENETWNLLVSRAANFTVRPQRIGTNRIQPRLEALRAPMEYIDGGKPGLLIDPSMRFFIRGLESRYVWTTEVNNSGDKRKVPDKSYTEANVIDAGQYLLLSEHRADGTSPKSFPSRKPRSTQMGHNGGPPMGKEPGGIQTSYNIHKPY